MSKLLRIAIVAEGWTDVAVIEAALDALLTDKPYQAQYLVPEDPASSSPFSKELPGGWAGVYRWCREAAERSGRLRDDIVFMRYDVVILHLDGDVASASYRDAKIKDAPHPGNLPCESPICPPPTVTTDALRLVVLSWCNELICPEAVAFCTPAMSTEAWVLAALFPNDPAVKDGRLECIEKPANLLQAKPVAGRLVRSGKKLVNVYRERKPDIRESWQQVRMICTEAERFSGDVLRIV